jgi:hypothetical protein
MLSSVLGRDYSYDISSIPPKMADASSSVAGSAFKSGQTPLPQYTSYRLNQNATTFNASSNGSSYPQWGSAGGYPIPERPRNSFSSSNMNLHEFSTGTSASVSHVVPLHNPGYTSHDCTQQSQGTAETPQTPTSGADGTQAHTLDDLLLPHPMIGGEGHQELSLQGLDQDDQGISTHRCPGCD